MTEPEPKTPDRPSLVRRLGPAGVLGVLWATVPAVAGIYLLTKLGPLSEWMRELGGAGVAVYVAIFVFAAGLGLLPTYAQAVLGGWVFGLGVGLPAALAGFCGAAVLGYAITRLVSRDRLEVLVAEHPKSAAIRDAMIGRSGARTVGIIALLRLPPNSPFALTNLAMAGTGVPLGQFLVGTAFGMLPRTAVTVFFAAAAARNSKDIQTFVKDGLGLPVFLAGLAALIVVLMIIGHIGNKAIEKVTGQNHGQKPGRKESPATPEAP